MKGRMYIERNVNVNKLREQQMDVHFKKLKQIKEERSSKHNSPHKRVASSVPRHRGYPTIERDFMIKQSNQRLLEKLVEISSGKFYRKPVCPRGFGQYSLNFSRRRQDFKKIEQDNMAMAKRIVKRQSPHQPRGFYRATMSSIVSIVILSCECLLHRRKRPRYGNPKLSPIKISKKTRNENSERCYENKSKLI